MRMRGLGLLLLLAVVAGAAGWWYAADSAEPEVSDAAPAPVAASDPALPYTPPEKVRSDADLPPLPTVFTTHDEKLGTPAEGGVVLPVVDGWDRYDFADGVQARWTAPGNPAGSYGVRVHVVDLPRSLAQVVAERAAALQFDGSISGLDVRDQAGDTLRASFIQNGFRRLQVTRWLSFDGNGIDVEVSATGRLIDEQGLEALVAKVATEVYRQQPHPPRPGSSLATPLP